MKKNTSIHLYLFNKFILNKLILFKYGCLFLESNL
jgi:hypothetical protein